MYTALRSTSRTIQRLLQRELGAEPDLASYFDPALAGSMVISLNTPQEMHSQDTQGVSVWLYRVVRDEHLLNTPPRRISETQIRQVPLPFRLHYLVTPIIDTTDDVYGPELEQIVLGKVLQIFHDHPTQRGSDLSGDFSGTDVELHARLEPLSLEEITRVWDAMDRPYQLSVSYEVSVAELESTRQPREIAPVVEVLPEYGLIVGRE